MASADIPALVALITNAAKTVEEQFKTSSKPYVPSLDDVTPHPFDTEISSVALSKAVRTIEGACAQLCATVARPNHTIINRSMRIYEPACIHVVVTFKIPDVLQEKPSGMHINEIGQKTGLEAGKLSRILRLLATTHIFREGFSKDVFANNRLSLQLLSTTAMPSICLYTTDETLKSLTVLAETLSDPEWGHSYAPNHAPFNKWSKYPYPMYVYFEGDTPEGHKRGARFGIGLGAWIDAVEANAVVKQFPWRDLRNDATVCDVGGGVGYLSIELARAYPTLRLILQDKPERIVQAQSEVWPKEFPEAIQEKRIEFKGMDFLTESPVKDCDIYYVCPSVDPSGYKIDVAVCTTQLRYIVHNWADKEVVQILSGVRKAMSARSRLLIHEFVMQNASREPKNKSEIVQAPQPLLANYGVGRIREYNLDINMMTMTNSRERSLEDMIKLTEEVGLRFVKLWEVGETYVIEFRTK